MTERDWALLFHLVGFALLFAGMIVAAAAQSGARRRERPGEIASLLGLTRVGVALMAGGALVLVATGLWPIEASNGDYSLGDAWISGAFGLLVLASVLGAIGGRRPKRARKLAARVDQEEDPPEELRALLDDPLSDALNYAAALAVVAAFLLMVWKPGL